MKSLTMFLRELLDETGSWCRVSTTRDFKEAASRIEKEGESFLTITLPTYARDLEKGLELGRLDPSLFIGFAKKGVMPLFLGGMLGLIFDPSNGSLLHEPSIDAIRGIRQICLAFAKIERPCSDERVARAFANYMQCEQDVKDCDRAVLNGKFGESQTAQFKRLGLILFGDLFSHLDKLIYDGRYGGPKGSRDEEILNPRERILPKHGPGTTAERLLGNKKYAQSEWTTRLESVFPFGENVLPNWTSYLEVSDHVTFLEPGAERPVRVITVPKTQKTPRIIAVEPTSMQYMQQGILEAITNFVSRDDTLRQFIGTSSQVPNQRLAQEGSLFGNLATLDLSDASDRVSYRHVRNLLANFPNLLAGVDACRSRKADVPGYGVIRLAKFASMGSALCFPFEAMVFLTSIFCGIELELGRQLDKNGIQSFLGKVRVYGDDIIVPVDYARIVIASLEADGLKVNRSKSFWNGKFRESCGKDYYGGHDVSVVRVRRDFPSSRSDTDEIISTVSLRNQLFDAGYDRLVAKLDALLEGLIPFPRVGRESQVLGKWTHDGGFDITKWDPALQRPLVKGVVVTAKLPRNTVDGWYALTKYFLSRGLTSDSEHLLYSGRPVSVDIKTRFGQPY